MVCEGRVWPKSCFFTGCESADGPGGENDGCVICEGRVCPKSFFFAGCDVSDEKGAKFDVVEVCCVCNGLSAFAVASAGVLDSAVGFVMRSKRLAFPSPKTV